MTLLTELGLLPRLIQEVIVYEAIADIKLTPEEAAAAEAEFCQRNKISTPEDVQAWAQQRYGPPEMVRTIAERERRLAKFKKESFEKEVDSYFLQRKRALDKVLYSLIRTKEVGLAQELYFRIHDDGQPFADLAKQYSEGQEAKTGGLIGPVELSVPHPALASMLSISQPGQVWPPRRIGEWYVVVRMEKFFPVQMDEPTRQRLIDELFQKWLKEQLDNNPIGIPSLPNHTASTGIPNPSSAPAPVTSQSPVGPSGANPSPKPESNVTSSSTSPDTATGDLWS